MYSVLKFEDTMALSELTGNYMFVICRIQPLSVEFDLPRKRSYNELPVSNTPVSENITQYHISLDVSNANSTCGL